MSYATLVDTTKCVGCRSCQVSCKQWNQLPAEATQAAAGLPGLQQPAAVSGKTRTIVTFNEVPDDKAQGGLHYVFVKRQCMHCQEPACVSACPVTAMTRTEQGQVIYDNEKCIGCRYCVWACPFGAPAVEWDSKAPRVNKCDWCYARAAESAPTARNGKSLDEAGGAEGFAAKHAKPACVSQCPPGALEFGTREELLARARQRIQDNPGKYVDHIYGEHEAGGTGWLYLSAVPFEKLGFPDVGTESYPKRSHTALGAVPPAVSAVGVALGAAYALSLRREKVKEEEAKLRQGGCGGGCGGSGACGGAGGCGGGHVAAEPREGFPLPIVAAGEGAVALGATLPAPAPEPAKPAPERPAPHAAPAEAHHPHVEFEPVKAPLWSRFNLAMLALVAFGGISLVLRFALGLGATTGLSDTYAWGLWIVFDLLWIALAAGAFVTAGLIYVFRQHHLYGVGRAAVLMGLLSYSFVAVTLLADLNLPWNVWQVAVNAPEHSAMFEVSWCVGLYVTILAVEFAPVPLKHFKLERYLAWWKLWSPVWVVGALTLFVFVMSHKALWTALAFAVFATLAWRFRAKVGEPATPLLPAIAAVTFSTMHQSSLGSLFLLMPDKVYPLWWSPIMPVIFLASAVAAGSAMTVLVELWLGRVHGRRTPVVDLAKLGNVSAFALLTTWVLRLGDLTVRGQWGALFGGHEALLFVAEALFGGVLPLALLLPRALRQRPGLLALGTALTAAGVVLHRTDTVLLAMRLRGPMPQVVAPAPYSPSLVEWGISVGLVALTILLFNVGLRVLPILPRREPTPSQEGV